VTGPRVVILTYTGLALLQRGLSFVLLPFVTRAMTVDEYGMISVVVSIGGLVGILLGGFLEQAVYRWSVPAISSAEGGGVPRVTYLWLMIALPTVGAVAGTGITFCTFEFLGVDSFVWGIEFAAVCTLASVSYFALPVLRATEKLPRYVLLASTSIIALLAGKLVIVIALRGGVLGWVWSDLAASLITFLLALLVVKGPRASFSKADVVTVLRYGVPLIPHLIAFWALASLSRPVTALLLPFKDVGTFSAAFNTVNVGLLVLSELNRAVLIDYSREKFPAPSKTLERTMRLQLVLTVLLTVCIGAFSPLAESILFPAQFRGVATLIVILSISCLAFGAYIVVMNFVVQTSANTSLSWIASVSGAVVITGLCLALVAPLGVEGVAIATSAGYATMAVVAVLITFRMGLAIRWRALASPSWAVVVLALSVVVSCSSALLAPDQMWLVTGGSIALIACLWAARGYTKAGRLNRS